MSLFSKLFKSEKENEPVRKAPQPATVKPSPVVAKPSPIRNNASNLKQNPKQVAPTRTTAKIQDVIKLEATDKMLQGYNYKRYVFLYANNEVWGTMKAYYNKQFTNIEILGTQNPQALIQSFEQSTIAQYLFLYITDKDELPYINNLIDSLSNSLDIITTFIFRSQNVPEAATRHFRTQYKIPVFKIPPKLTDGILNSMMANVVQSQPLIEIKELSRVKVIPQVRYDIEDIKHDIYKLDIERLKSHVKNLEESVMSNTDDINLLKLAIYKAEENSLNDFKAQLCSLGHIKYLQTIEDECTRVLNTQYSINTIDSNYSILVANRIAANSMKMTAIENTLNEFIRTSQSAVVAREAEINSYNGAATRLKNKSGDVEILKQEQNALRDKLKSIFTDMKFHIQLISNASLIYINILSTSKNMLMEYITNPKLVSITPYLNKRCKKIDSSVREKTDLITGNSNIMAQALARTNSILLDQEALIEIKDVIVVDPLQFIKTDRVIVTTAETVETNLHHVAQLVYSQPSTGFSTVLNQIVDNNTCILYIGHERSSFLGTTHIAKENIFNCEEFLSSKPRNIGTMIVDLSDAKTYPDEIVDDIFNQLTYISNLYSSVVVYINSKVINRKLSNLEMQLIGYCKTISIVSIDDEEHNNVRKNDIVHTLNAINTIQDAEDVNCIVFFNKTSMDRVEELDSFRAELDGISMPIQSCAIPKIKTLCTDSPALSQRVREMLYTNILRRK